MRHLGLLHDYQVMPATFYFKYAMLCIYATFTSSLPCYVYMRHFISSIESVHVRSFNPYTAKDD